MGDEGSKISSPHMEAVGLSKSYDGLKVVDSVSLAVPPGEIHALIGLNGAGKTTLMRMFLGMIKPDSGNAFIGGVSVFDGRPDWSDVGYLIETPFAYPELSVIENLKVSAILHGVDKSSVNEMVASAADRFGITQYAGRAARKLSLGNKQKLALASATLHKPSILVLDEPANGLDPAGVVAVREMLAEIADEGVSIFVSSHHLDQVARIAHRMWVLQSGKLVGELDPEGTDLETTFFEMIYEADTKSEAS